jgi:hypothetical protein
MDRRSTVRMACSSSGAGSVVGYGLAVAVELAGGYAVHPAGGG